MTDSAHAKLAASASHRWIACPGSVALAASLPPAPSSSYAREGTAAHAIGHQYLDRGIDIDSWRSWSGVDVDAEMIAAVKIYIRFIETLLAQSETATLETEKRVTLTSIDPEMYGTADAIINQMFDTLTIVDYKHGAGIEVEAQDNSQLAYYALGAIERYGTDYDTLNMIIVQPRIFGKKIKTWRVKDVDGFVFHWTNIFKSARSRTILQPNHFVTGPHCRFCPGINHCNAIYADTLRAASIDFDTLDNIDPDKIVWILRNTEHIKSLLNSITQYATRLLQNGDSIEGYKLVNRRSRRKWIDERRIAAFLAAHNIENVYNSKQLKTPAQIESLCVNKELRMKLQQFIKTPESGTVIAPMTDRREAVSPFDEFEIVHD